ncbi:MAG: hypothetical protein IJ783_01285 [Kiritimatiellae bacterium]|nr:hypothetical protein [Kiritimatiellia bacterium]
MWFVDGAPGGRTGPGEEFETPPLAPGRHVVTCVPDDGSAAASAEFTLSGP